MFERIKVNGCFYGYQKYEKLSNHQTIGIYFLREPHDLKAIYYVILAIGNKKKHIEEWASGHRDRFGTSKRQETLLLIEWLDSRRKRVYERGLQNLGYRMVRRENKMMLAKKIRSK